MSEKLLNGRITLKHDTEENWLKAINFIPKPGEVIIYDPDLNYNYPRIKVGDGSTLVNNLKFIDTNKQDKIFVQDTEPVNAVTGTLWVDTSIQGVMSSESVEF